MGGGWGRGDDNNKCAGIPCYFTVIAKAVTRLANLTSCCNQIVILYRVHAYHRNINMTEYITAYEAGGKLDHDLHEKQPSPGLSIFNRLGFHSFRLSATTVVPYQATYS